MYERWLSQYQAGGWRFWKQHASLQRSGMRLPHLLGGGLMGVAAVVPMDGGRGRGSMDQDQIQKQRDEEKQQQHQGSSQDFGHPKRRVTDVLLLLNVILFSLQWLSKDLLTFWGAKVNSYIAAGQWWRLITPAFLHSSVFHLLINSHALNTLGPQLEIVSGSSRFVSVYLVSAVVGTSLSALLTPAASIGSSCAVFGVGAALAIFYYRHKELLGRYSENGLQTLGLAAVLNIAYSVSVKNIDNWAHIGGAFGGALVALLLGPRMYCIEKGRFVDKPPLSIMATKPQLGRSQAADNIQVYEFQDCSAEDASTRSSRSSSSRSRRDRKAHSHHHHSSSGSSTNNYSDYNYNSSSSSSNRSSRNSSRKRNVEPQSSPESSLYDSTSTASSHDSVSAPPEASINNSWRGPRASSCSSGPSSCRADQMDSLAPDPGWRVDGGGGELSKDNVEKGDEVLKEGGKRWGWGLWRKG